MVSPTGKRPLENETEADYEPYAEAQSHRRQGRKMARLLCSHAGCTSLAALGGLCKKHNPGCHCTYPGCNLVGANSALRSTNLAARSSS